MTNGKALALHVALLIAISAALAASWYVPVLRQYPPAAAALVGAVCAAYGKWFGKPIPPVLAQAIRDMEPQDVRAILDAQAVSRS